MAAAVGIAGLIQGLPSAATTPPDVAAADASLRALSLTPIVLTNSPEEVYLATGRRTVDVPRASEPTSGQPRDLEAELAELAAELNARQSVTTVVLSTVFFYRYQMADIAAALPCATLRPLENPGDPSAAYYEIYALDASACTP